MKRILCLALALCMLLTAAAFADQEAEKQLEKEIGAFEITAEQREKAKANEAGYPVLDAGRGNPNWINAQARYAFIRLHYDRDSETVFLLDEHVGNKMTNEQTARWILTQGYGEVPVICDSAEKKSVADYRSLGVNAKEAVKGPGSVEYGMKWLQRRRIVIDRRRTPHAYEEFVGYEYEKNKADEWISGYPDRNNHSIDAVRYALERVMNKYRSNA